MNLDDLLQRYLGTLKPSRAAAGVQEAGLDRRRVDLGLETDRKRRFAIWSLLYILGQAPDLDVVFKEDSDREAARNFTGRLAAFENDETIRQV